MPVLLAAWGGEQGFGHSNIPTRPWSRHRRTQSSSEQPLGGSAVTQQLLDRGWPRGSLLVVQPAETLSKSHVANYALVRCLIASGAVSYVN